MIQSTSWHKPMSQWWITAKTEPSTTEQPVICGVVHLQWRSNQSMYTITNNKKTTTLQLESCLSTETTFYINKTTHSSQNQLGVDSAPHPNLPKLEPWGCDVHWGNIYVQMFFNHLHKKSDRVTKRKYRQGVGLLHLPQHHALLVYYFTKMSHITTKGKKQWKSTPKLMLALATRSQFAQLFLHFFIAHLISLSLFANFSWTVAQRFMYCNWSGLWSCL